MSCILRQRERERERERQTDREHIICVCVRAMYIARRSSRLVIIPDFPEFLPTGGKMPRGSQGAHAGALGGKMWVILRRIQQAHFRRNRREPRHVGCSAPSTTSARSHALFRGFSYKNFAGGFSYKNWADRASEGRLASKPMVGGQDARVFAHVRAFSGVVPQEVFCANAIFGGLCYNFFGKQCWNLSPHCRAANLQQGDKTRSK